MTSYLFVFGRTPALSLLELQALGYSALYLAPGIGLVEEKFLPRKKEALADVLGGTTKIAQVLGEVSSLSAENLAGFITPGQSATSITFGVSRYDSPTPIARVMLRQIKDILAPRFQHIRFIEPRDGSTLTSVVVQKQQVYELVLVARDGKWLIGKTLAVQDFEAWNRRDWGRPFADPKAGMLPPKVARMAVNIAVGSRGCGKTLLDPFCGMGTIIAEAMLVGCNCVGSDQAPEVIEKARRNLVWLAATYPTVSLSQVKLETGEATHVSERLATASVDTIVTEPFLGPADIVNRIKLADFNAQTIRNTVKGLDKLYLGCLRDWYRVLKPAATVVMALPRYVLGSRTYFVKKTIDSCEKLGYTTLHGPVEYSRPQAMVRREFLVFKKL